MTTIELRQERKRIYDLMKNMLDQAEKENRSFSIAEEGRYGVFNQQIDELGKRIEANDINDKRGKEMGEIAGRRVIDHENTGPAAQTGEQRVFKADQKWDFGDTYQVDEKDVSLVRWMRALTTKDFASAPAEYAEYQREQKRAQSLGGPTLGGYLAPSILSDRIIGTLRNKLAVGQAGAVSMNYTGAELSLASIDSEPTASWTSENAALTESSMSFGRITLHPYKVGCLVPVSNELLAGAANMEALLVDSLAYAAAKAIDSACLTGNGAGQPTGIYNTVGIEKHAVGGALVRFDEISEAYHHLLGHNVEGGNVSAIYAAALARKINELVNNATDYLPLEGVAPSYWRTMKKFVSEQASSGYLFMGAFSKLVIAFMRNISITPSSDYGFNKDQTYFRVVAVVDAALTQPSAFHVSTGITV